MTTTAATFLNAAAYRFVALDAAASLVAPLRDGAARHGLKGTIIVADEGINLFVAGAADPLREFLAWMGHDGRFVDRLGAPAFADLAVRFSTSTTVPFKRLRVKHRPEIVTMRRAGIAPGAARAPSVSPERLAAWLASGHDDDGRAVVLLDTRNAFEVAMGTFDGARHLGITRFEGFPDAVEALRPALEGRTVVTFCTGGIRCEKAALHMQDQGFERVLQLDGGILGYFARVGDAHWDGTCFVFDERVALGADLTPAGQGPDSAASSSGSNPAARRASRLNGPRGRGAWWVAASVT